MKKEMIKRFLWSFILAFFGALIADYAIGAPPSPCYLSSGTVTACYKPINVASGGSGLTTGTSGGIPYFSDTTTMASSGALTANGVVYGGGAGVSPAATGAGTGSDWLVAGSPPSFSSTTSTPKTFSDSTDSTSSSTGAVKVTGGAGVGKSLYVGNNVVVGKFLFLTPSATFDVASDTSLSSGDLTTSVVTTSNLRLVTATGGAFDLVGIAAPTLGVGTFLFICNNSGQTMTVKHESGTEGTSTARIHTTTGADVTIQTGSGIAFVYSNSPARWVQL
jgi:hypothetical protein